MSDHQHARVLTVLARHIGAPNALTMKQLSAEIAGFAVGGDRGGISPRRIRTIVEELRMDGHHICAHPKRGYWMANTPEELEETCKFLRKRALTSLRQLAAMTKQALPDLLGQLHLPT